MAWAVGAAEAEVLQYVALGAVGVGDGDAAGWGDGGYRGEFGA